MEKLVRGYHFQHRLEVIRSSNFSPEGKRRLKFIVRVFPRRPVKPKKISDIEAGTGSWWKGADIRDKREGVAARLEKRVGRSMTKPTRKKFLLIPWGDFRTPGGKPRKERRDVGGRTVTAPILIRKLPNTRIVKTQKGLRVVQRIAAGERGRFDSGAKGVKKKGLGSRDRVVGLLVRSIKTPQGLDFFASWDRLAGDRDKAAGAFLEKVTAMMARN